MTEITLPSGASRHHAPMRMMTRRFSPKSHFATDSRTEISHGGALSLGESYRLKVSRKIQKGGSSSPEYRRRRSRTDDTVGEETLGKDEVNEREPSVSSKDEFVASSTERNRLNAVILNAGMFGSIERELSADGYELQLASNFLGHFHLANSLVPLLRFGAPSRIVVVASESHRLIGRTFLNDIQMEHEYKRCKAFARSKLCEVILARQMAKRVRSKRIVVNALHPGMVPTGIFRGTWMHGVAKLFGTSAEKAAKASVYLAVDDEVADITGEYFVNRRITRPSAEAENDEIGGQLWTLSEELIHRVLSK